MCRLASALRQRSASWKFRDPQVLYWFQLVRKGGVRFVPHLIDDASGVGVDVLVRDLNGDGRLDILSSNKKGAFLFLRQR